VELPVGSAADLSSQLVERHVVSTEVVAEGRIFDLRRDVVDLGDQGEVTREYLDHPGAVVIVALREIDGVDHVVLIRQYRYPVRAEEWELPAGILDVAGEAPALSAARELAEEVELRAERWDVVIDFFASPGSTSEALRVFLARDVATVTDSTFQRAGEEAGITGLWVPLDDAYAAVLTGRIQNPGAIIGLMATWGARQREWSTLRPADTPWPWHAGG
jgi:8-oxo-dGTP pyrophosphatase MutT (NUDIX family)